MWDEIERQLALLLSEKVFPELLNVPAYQKLLKDGRPERSLCAAAAHSIVHTNGLKKGIREFGVNGKAAVREWTEPLYRAVSSKNNPYGSWWFDEKLVQRWAGRYPPGTPGRKRTILESMRPMLAVCEDWNGFTDLRVMRPKSSLPVITGQGRHMPIYSEKDSRHKDFPNVFFIGGFVQVFVPFVNHDSVSEYLL